MITTYRIVAPYYVADLVKDEDTIVQTAPILKWAIGKSWEFVREYLQRKGYTIEPVIDEAETRFAFETKAGTFVVYHAGSFIQKIEYFDHEEEKIEVKFDQLPDHVQIFVIETIFENIEL